MLFLNLFRRSLFPVFSVDGESDSTGGTTTVEDPPENDPEPEPEPEEVVTIGGKEYKASDLVGADGIPRLKNLNTALEEKNKELKEAKDLVKGIVTNPPAPAAPAPNPQTQFNAVVDAVKSKYPDLADDQVKAMVEIMQGGINAQAVARAPIDAEICVDRAKANLRGDDRADYERWQDEVNEALFGMPTVWKQTPENANQAVKNAIDLLRGRNKSNIIKEAEEAVRGRGGVRPRDTNTAGSGSKQPKGGGNRGTGLTDAQEKDRQSMGNMPTADYKSTLKKSQDRDKAANRPIRQTLN